MAEWSDLSNDLWQLVLQKLSFIDIIRFKAVCSSWHALAESFISLSPSISPIPWLWIPQKPKVDDDHSFCFFDMEMQKVWELRNMPKDLFDGLCIGSSHGWLVFFDTSLRPCLFNPLSKVRRQLPKLVSIWADGHEIKIEIGCSSFGYAVIRSVETLRERFSGKAILSSNPSCSNKFGIFLQHYIGSRGESRLAYSFNGDEEWSTLEEDPFMEDFLCKDNNLYVLKERSNKMKIVEVWNIQNCCLVKTMELKGGLQLSRSTLNFMGRHSLTSCRVQNYLVDSSGELLLVQRFIGNLWYKQSEYRPEPVLFQVYKLDMDQQKWVEVDSLNDYTLFLGGNHSVSVLFKDVPHCENNAIYFTENAWETKLKLWEMQRRNCRRCFDMGVVFKLIDKSIQPCYQGEWKITDLVPLWIVPNPW